MRKPPVVASFLLGAVLSAQAITIPGGLAGREANGSTGYPWACGAAPMRVQYLYDAVHFTGQGVTGPVAVTRLRWRAQGGASSGGGTWGGVTVRLATAPYDQAAAVPAFAANLGADQLVAFAGPVAVAPTWGATPNAWYVDVVLQVPFVYDPRRGDLVIDLAVDGAFTGVTPAATDARANTTMCTRVWALGDHRAAVGTVQADFGAVVQVTAVADALVPAFTVDRTDGAAPLSVAFTERAWTSDPLGILAWLWDFDSDGVVDSSERNPVWTFPCGTWDVTLHVVDAGHGLRTLRQQRLIATDTAPVVVAFGWQLVGRDTLRLVDLTTPAATAWAWDFDGDGTVDSTAPGPTVALGPGPRLRDVSLSVMRGCRGPFSRRQRVVVADSLVTSWAGGEVLPAGAMQFCDVQVTTPSGLDLLAVDLRVAAPAGTPCHAVLFAAVGGSAGRDVDPARWRVLGTIPATAAGPDQPTFAHLAMPPHLEPGLWGLALCVLDAAAVGSTVAGAVVQSTPAAVVTHGFARGGAFGGALLQHRVWNGALHWAPTLVTGAAGSGFLAEGCAGPVGVPSWTTLELPESGATWRAELAPLPGAGAFALLGLDRSRWAGGPLPLALDGAPGCWLGVRPDDVRWLVGSAGRLPVAIAVPATTSLRGLPVFVQALAPAPGHNALGLIASDVLAARIGG